MTFLGDLQSRELSTCCRRERLVFGRHCSGLVGEVNVQGAPIQRKAARNRCSSGPFALLAAYAAICLANGSVVLISILRGKAAAATGAVISNTPFTYSAVSFSTLTPSGSASVLSNTP